jgi:hypothetical protein
VKTRLPAAFKPHALSTKSATSTARGTLEPFAVDTAGTGAGMEIDAVAGVLRNVTGAAVGTGAVAAGVADDEDAPPAFGAFVRVFAAFFAGLGATPSAFNESEVVDDVRLPDEGTTSGAGSKNFKMSLHDRKCTYRRMRSTQNASH